MGHRCSPEKSKRGQELLPLPAAPGLQAKLAGPAAENRRQKEQKKKKDVPRTHHQLVVCVGGGARSGARHAATKGGVPKRRSQASIAGQPTQPWCRVSASSPPSRQRTAVTRRGTQTHGAQALEKLAAPTSLGGAGHPASPTPHRSPKARRGLGREQEQQQARRRPVCPVPASHSVFFPARETAQHAHRKTIGFSQPTQHSPSHTNTEQAGPKMKSAKHYGPMLACAQPQHEWHAHTPLTAAHQRLCACVPGATLHALARSPGMECRPERPARASPWCCVCARGCYLPGYRCGDKNR